MHCGPAWLFDDSPIPDPQGHGERAVEFLTFLRHPKSRAPDKALKWDPWQLRIIRKIYGPCDEEGRRICRVVFLQVGRGNRKTTLGSSIGLLHTFGPERVPSGQVISAAADRKQARIAFEEAGGIIMQTPPLAAAARIQDFKNRIVHPKSGAFFESISCEAATQFGRTPTFALVDELWAHRKVDLWHAIRTGLTKVAGSLLVVITTAGRGTTTPDYPIFEYAKKCAADPTFDPSFLPIVFEADPDCDWTDERVWHAVNPGLAHGYPDLAGLRQLAHEARERPSDREAFCQFHLGIRQQHSTSPFIEMSVFDECATEVDFELLRGRPCWLGVDMSSTTDLTAIVAVWPDDESSDAYFAASWFFVPRDNLQARAARDGVEYPRFAKEGHIIATEGNAIDYRAVENKIRELCDLYDVREIGFDKAYGQPVMGPLLDDGLPVVTVPQGWITQSPALNLLERAIITRRFRWHRNPCLRWCFENVSLHVDSAGNRTMHKGRSRDRIDGACAAWIALSRAAAGESTGFVYSNAEERPAGLLFV